MWDNFFNSWLFWIIGGIQKNGQVKLYVYWKNETYEKLETLGKRFIMLYIYKRSN